jgi:type II secretory pathway pseudopilin PulG
MEPYEQSPEKLLLDYHLGRLGQEERSWIEAELERDAQLREKSERLGHMLRPLDHWTVPTAPPSLIDRVLARTEGPGWAKPGATATSGESEYRGRSFSLPLREILAVAACIALLASVLIPGISDVRSRAQQTVCASNLGSIFQGTRLYQQAFGGSLPFAGKVVNASWLPGGSRVNPYASNSRHIFLLAKFNYGPKPEDFICPASKTGEPMRADDLAAYDDFASVRNNSYDSLNLGGDNPNVRPRGAIAYMSDANPLFKNGRFDETVDPDHTNSPAHKGRGQTVLTLDGSAQWTTTPFYGAKRDNLWLIGEIRHYSGTESPTSEDDAQLVPGYPTTDASVRRYLAQ